MVEERGGGGSGGWKERIAREVSTCQEAEEMLKVHCLLAACGPAAAGGGGMMMMIWSSSNVHLVLSCSASDRR